ncbi:MAG: type IA DNA topoisomerase, partial [Bacteroidales bacterium]|nr:type IA DNA topoisomerase [Bacteroidales bacterium]
AEILSKLEKIEYLNLNKKTQIITPTKLGEIVYEVVFASIRPMLNAELTASWEKGLTMVANGTINEKEYMTKLEAFVSKMTNSVKGLNNQLSIMSVFQEVGNWYK